MQTTTVRTTVDGFLSIYDTINSYELGVEASEIWKEIQNQNLKLKDIAERKLILTPNSIGKKTPHITPCIPSTKVQELISAIADWKKSYKKSDYTITITPSKVENKVVAFEARPITTAVETVNQQVAVLKTPMYVVGKEYFDSSAEIEKRLKGILRNTKANSYVEGEDRVFMINLLSRCDYAKALLRKGMYGIKVQHLEGNSSKNFAVEVPGKTQKISITNYLNPSKHQLFNVKTLTR